MQGGNFYILIYKQNIMQTKPKQNHHDEHLIILKMFIQQQKIQTLEKFQRIIKHIQNNKKYKQFEQALNQRILMVSKYVTSITNTFFTLLKQSQFLCLITQVCLNQKIEKFKKNIMGSLQKITVNLENGNKIFKENLKKFTQQNKGDKTKAKKVPKKKRISKKSKNSKISSQKSMFMIDWLLNNFENPYPSNEQKIKLAKESDTSVNQVNNWFINARQRTIKNYFIKEVKYL